MKFGIFVFPTDYAIDPGSMAVLTEQAGFESLFFPDHTHIPASRETPFPLGEPLRPEYSHNLDLFVSLTAAACATTKLVVGTGICLLAQRDPIVCAKEVATLDLLSGGRVVFGVGGGWNLEEMRNHGGDPATRWSLLEDRVKAMQTIWTEEEATYHGRFTDFDRIWSWPKPLQRPYPPVLLAGNGPRVLDRVLDWADGWAPLPFPDVPDRVRELRARAADLGRAVSVTVYGLPSPPDPKAIEEYADAGVERCVFHLPPVDRAQAEHLLDGIRSALDDAGLLT